MARNTSIIDSSIIIPTVSLPTKYVVQVGDHFLSPLIEKTPFNFSIIELFNTTYRNATLNISTNTNVAIKKPGYGIGDFQISLSICIFFLAVIGNFLVILTLIQNRRMRTITNLFLLNLAISDMLLGVFCMPVTLIGTVLRNFIFGAFMCRFLPYMQGELKLYIFRNLHIILVLIGYMNNRDGHQ